ncbi:MAG: DUF5011 domain-containing protein, partial [Cenarchaeum sp. SB0666_bin_15]|nr:DUF5011 domain-containing protein [Cenarchaeum sp. SB0666_bin_15]
MNSIYALTIIASITVLMTALTADSYATTDFDKPMVSSVVLDTRDGKKDIVMAFNKKVTMQGESDLLQLGVIYSFDGKKNTVLKNLTGATLHESDKQQFITITLTDDQLEAINAASTEHLYLTIEHDTFFDVYFDENLPTTKRILHTTDDAPVPVFAHLLRFANATVLDLTFLDNITGYTVDASKIKLVNARVTLGTDGYTILDVERVAIPMTNGIISMYNNAKMISIYLSDETHAEAKTFESKFVLSLDRGAFSINGLDSKPRFNIYTFATNSDNVGPPRPTSGVDESEPLRVTNVGPTHASVNWIPQMNADGYSVQWSEPGGSNPQSYDTDTGIIFYDITNLNPDTIYYLSVHTDGDQQVGEIVTFETLSGDSEQKDTIAPIITLAGEQSVTITTNTPYVDAGATCTDDIDGTIQPTIINTVDITTPGIYTVTYDCTDTAGNNAQLVRNITVNEDVVVLPLQTQNTINISSDSATLDAGGTIAVTIALDVPLEQGKIKVSLKVKGCGSNMKHCELVLDEENSDNRVKRTGDGKESTLIFREGATTATFALQDLKDTDKDRSIKIMLGKIRNMDGASVVLGNSTLSVDVINTRTILEPETPEPETPEPETPEPETPEPE